MSAGTHRGQKRTSNPLELESRGCWEQNLGPVKEHCMLLTTRLSLQLPVYDYFALFCYMVLNIKDTYNSYPLDIFGTISKIHIQES